MRFLRPASAGRCTGALGALAVALASSASEPQAGASGTAPVASVLPASVAAPAPLGAGVAEPQSPPKPAPAAESGSERSGWSLLRSEPPELVASLLDEKLVLLDGPKGPHRHGGGMQHAYVVFEQPADRTFALLAQTSRQGEFRSEIDRIETVATLPDGNVDEHAIRMLFVELVYRLRYHVDPKARRITWELDPGYSNPLRSVVGSWEIYELGPTRSLGRFGTQVDVGEALPSWLEEAVTRKNLPGTLERCRRWVDAGGARP